MVIVGAVFLLFVSLQIYAALFPYVDLSIEAFLNEGSSTGGGYNISRLNAFSEINTIFFHDSFLKNLFGYGFGNCEYSTINIFCSDFYKLYGFYNYRWFANQWIFLETGYAGVISFCSFFVISFIISFKNSKNIVVKNKSLIETGIIMTIICLISFFYNSLLKADYGYIAYFSLAIIGLVIKFQNNDKANRIVYETEKCKI